MNSIKDDFAKKKKEKEDNIRMIEIQKQINCEYDKMKIQDIEKNIKEMEDKANLEIINLKKDSERRIQEMKEMHKKELDNLDNEYRLKFEELEQEHQRRINANNNRINQILSDFQMYINGQMNYM